MRAEVNPRIKDDLRRDPGVHQELVQWGHKVARSARFFAPFRTGHLVRSLFVWRRSNGTVWVGFHDFKAWWVEYGAYGRVPPFRARAPLRKALRAHGLRYTPTKHDSLGGSRGR